MKKIFFLIAAAIVTMSASAQFHVNPQFGVNVMNMTNLPDGVKFSGKVGVSFGSDFRIGDTFQLIPGIHYTSTVGAYEDANNNKFRDDVVMHGLKLKALLGLNLVNTDLFKLRANAGPSYSFTLSNKTKNFNGDFKNGDFYLQGGLGVDIAFLTFDLGYARSMTDKLEQHPGSKLQGFYTSIGFVF